MLIPSGLEHHPKDIQVDTVQLLAWGLVAAVETAGAEETLVSDGKSLASGEDAPGAFVEGVPWASVEEALGASVEAFVDVSVGLCDA